MERKGQHTKSGAAASESSLNNERKLTSNAKGDRGINDEVIGNGVRILDSWMIRGASLNQDPKDLSQIA